MKFVQSILAVVALAMACEVSFAEEWRYIGEVTYVVDGDTFDMLSQDSVEHRIRPAGFDTPERGRTCFDEATGALRQLIEGKVVEAKCYKYQPASGKQKRRDVCRVTFEGKDIGLYMIQAGVAWHSKAWMHEQGKDERREYAEAECKAMQDGRGCLWAENYPSRSEPWDSLQ